MIFKNNTKKVVLDIEKLAKITEVLRDATGHKIVATIGTWDILHIGHLRYLNKAKGYGDILVVGTDTDSAVKRYKGPLRPIIPQEERLEMLSYQECVDLVTLVDDVDEKGKWGCDLIKKIRPDVFIAVEDSYPEEQLNEIKMYCVEVVVLPRQAENTSTSKVIQDTVKKTLISLLGKVEEGL